MLHVHQRGPPGTVEIKFETRTRKLKLVTLDCACFEACLVLCSALRLKPGRVELDGRITMHLSSQSLMVVDAKV